MSKIIAEKYPQSGYRLCVQLMYNNIKKSLSSRELKKRMWKIFDSTTEEVFEKHMDELRVFSQVAYQHLLDVASKEKWVKAYFYGHAKCDTHVNKFLSL